MQCQHYGYLFRICRHLSTRAIKNSAPPLPEESSYNIGTSVTAFIHKRILQSTITLADKEMSDKSHLTDKKKSSCSRLLDFCRDLWVGLESEKGPISALALVEEELQGNAL